MAPSAVIPRVFSLIIRGIVGNELSKHKVWCLCCGRYFINRITDPSDKQFSAPILLYKKKSYIIPDAPALTNTLNPHFMGFLGLYCRIPFLLVLAGVICLSIDITSSVPLSNNSPVPFQAMAELSTVYHAYFGLLISCQRDGLNHVNLYISSLIMCQQLHKLLFLQPNG